MFKLHQTIAVGKYNVQVISQIGEGGHSNIYLVKETKTGEEFVLKKSTPVLQAQMDMAQREVALNRQLKNPNIVEYRGDSIAEYRRSGKKVYDVYLLMEFCPGGHLLDLVNTRRSRNIALTESEILKYFVQICRAVDYLHRHKPPVAHRDLKLENVLLASGGRAKLCDFGSSSTKVVKCETKEERMAEEEIVEKYTTPYYRAPEMCDLFSGQEISTKVDIWALGCMLYAMAFGKHAFEDGGKLGILGGRYVIPQNHNLSKEFISLLKWLLLLNPEKRPQIGDVLDYVEELTGTTTGTCAKTRGSGTGERPKDATEGASDDKDVNQLTANYGEMKLSDSKKPRSRKKTSLASITSTMTQPTNVESQGRSRAPSAALRARLAKRSSASKSDPRRSSASSVVSNGSAISTTSSELFDPFDSTPEESNVQTKVDDLWEAFDRPTSSTTSSNVMQPVQQPQLPPQSPSTQQPHLSPQQQVMQSMRANTMNQTNVTQQQYVPQQGNMFQQHMAPVYNNRMPQQMNGMPQQMNGMPQQMNGMPQQMNGMPQQMNGMPQQMVMMPQNYTAQQMNRIPSNYNNTTIPQNQPRSRTSSASSNPFDELESFAAPSNQMVQPSMAPQFFSNPGLQSSSISGFPLQQPQANLKTPVSQQQQFFSTPGPFSR